MAKTTPRRGAAPVRAAAKSRKVAGGEGEAGEEASGSGNADMAVVVFTTLLLVAALVLVDKIQGMNLDGMIFN